MEQQLAVEWLINQLEEKGNVSEHTKSRILEFKIDVSEYLDLKRQAKKMEKENEKNACLWTISKYLHKQAIKESEKKDKEKIKITEDKDKIEEQDKIHIISRENGTIIRINEQWMVSHNFIDPYGQLPISLPIHINSYISTQLTENLKVYFDIVFEKNEYFALI